MAPKNDVCKVKLNYPCQWLYKVIGTDHEQLHKTIMEIINNIPCEISISNCSSSGKYICLNLEITVQSEEERNSIYSRLKSHSLIKIVL